jgi:cyclase
MLSVMRLTLGLAVGLVCLRAVALAQTGDGLYGNTYTVTDLGHGVHTLTWNQKPGTFAIGNSTFIVGDRDVIVVDSGFSRSTGRAILEGLRTVTDKPVSMVINTHWHGDHIFGNQVFRSAFPAVRFVAHPATREGILTGEAGYRDVNRPKVEARIGELTARTNPSEAETQELQRAHMQIEAWQGDYVLPDVLVEQKLTIFQGNRSVHVVHLGEANTKGDLVVHLPEEKIVISGDMAITPMQFAFFSSPRKWIDTLGRLAAIDAAVIVPGHGPVQKDRRFLADLQTMLRAVVDQVDSGLKAGMTLEQLQKTVSVVPPAGSVYEKASAAALDRLFRLPAIESAVKEKG